MKTAVSIPDPTFVAAEKLARRLGVSRSHLYAVALERYREQQRDDAITEQLDRLYAEVDSALDPVLKQAGRRTLEATEW